MLAARERAAGGAARAALLRRPEDAAAGPSTTPAATVPEIRPASDATGSVEPATGSAEAATRPAAGPASAGGAADAPKVDEMDTLARLREAKRRARQR
jgi:hypothetical protein